MTTSQIKNCLEKTNRVYQIAKGASSNNTPGIQSAAVLLPLFKDQRMWHLLLIRRTHQHHDQHSGQVAFPGGKKEKIDKTLIATALREAKEEINLMPSDVNILGQLSEFKTVTNYMVKPFVGKIPWPYSLKREIKEVDKIFSIPLEWLADANNHEVRPWKPSQQTTDPYPIIFFKPYRGEILWGASAKMVIEFVERLEYC